MNFKVIAVDFDGTLCINKWPAIGEPNYDVINYLKKERLGGNKIILWTCRVGDRLIEAIEWCKEQGLEFDAVNRNLPEAITEFGDDPRKIFAHEYIDDQASLQFALPFSGGDDWASHEVELACEIEVKAKHEPEDDATYGQHCYSSALKAYRTLLADGHSGFSIQLTKGILNRLIDGKCLSPIEDNPDIWEEMKEIKGKEGEKNYQCKRMSSLFKKVDPDGTVSFTDIHRVTCVDVDKPDVAYTNGTATRLIDAIFPISMPYFPTAKKFKVVREQFLTDVKNGDYDTVAFLYILTPDGKRVELNRYFKEVDGTMVSIDRIEFGERKAHRVDAK